MRITGGKLKGRIIKCPDGVIRPAMDRMRESVFSIIGDLTDKSWLDLFSGSGTIAIEAVSRKCFGYRKGLRCKNQMSFYAGRIFYQAL